MNQPCYLHLIVLRFCICHNLINYGTQKNLSIKTEVISKLVNHNKDCKTITKAVEIAKL